MDDGIGKALTQGLIDLRLAGERRFRFGHDERRARHAFHPAGQEKLPLGSGHRTGGVGNRGEAAAAKRSEEHTSELQSLMRISYAVFCLKKNKSKLNYNYHILTV